MKRKTKRGSGIHAYLESTGILSAGDATAIELAKKTYWALVRKEYKKAKRKACNSYTIFLTDAELKVVAPAAQKQLYSVTAFIKQAALSHSNGQGMINKKSIGAIREATMLHYNTIETLCEEQQLPKHIASKLLQETAVIEKDIIRLLT